MRGVVRRKRSEGRAHGGTGTPSASSPWSTRTWATRRASSVVGERCANPQGCASGGRARVARGREACGGWEPRLQAAGPRACAGKSAVSIVTITSDRLSSRLHLGRDATRARVRAAPSGCEGERAGRGSRLRRAAGSGGRARACSSCANASARAACCGRPAAAARTRLSSCAGLKRASRVGVAGVAGVFDHSRARLCLGSWRRQRDQVGLSAHAGAVGAACTVHTTIGVPTFTQGGARRAGSRARRSRAREQEKARARRRGRGIGGACHGSHSMARTGWKG